MEFSETFSMKIVYSYKTTLNKKTVVSMKFYLEGVSSQPQADPK